MNDLKFDKVRFWIILVLALIGIGLCVELGYIFYKTNFLTQYAPSFCAVSELIDCDGVAESSYALSMGVPNALWGLILYAIVIFLLFVDRIQAKFKNTIFDVFKNPRCYIAFLGLLSFAISMVLAFISIFEIKKICALCFVTYFINLFIAYSAKHKGFFFMEDILTTIYDFIAGAKKYFALFIIVLIAFVSTLFYLNDSLIFSPKLKKQKTQKEFFEARKNKYAVAGNILGNKDAKVVINVYSDYNCPFCKVLNIMLHKAAKERDILVNEINYPLDITCNKKIGSTLGGHETSCMFAKYALAAKKQNAFWAAANVLFYENPYDINDLFNKISKANVYINAQKFVEDIKSKEIEEELQKDIELGYSKAIKGTPIIEINGIIVKEGMMHYDELLNEIDLAQKRATK